MFFGLASGAVETGGIVVEQVLSDIETLNRAAFEGTLRSHRGVVSRLRAPRGQVRAAAARRQHGRQLRPDRRRDARAARPRSRARRIAIPGTLTTAYLTLRLYEPDFEYVVVPFDEIQQAVLDGKAEAGLLIHEGQLTYQDEGLHEDRRPRRVVGGADRRPAAAARRQHHPARSRRRDDRQGLEDAARQHRLRAVAPRRGGRVRAAVRPRPRSRARPTSSSGCT